MARIQRHPGGRIVVVISKQAVQVPSQSQAKGRGVAGIESEVLDTFLAELTAVDNVPPQVTESLAALLAADKLPKPDQLVALYTEASGESTL
ncbi:hypothetical protein [Kocuria rhizophila]|uniref:hypothetical protein n=1 Tax=Kocuria rhizophila TaxID=72000 RepID=UPI001AD99AFE|nr:hypothetical protein [Kocuria rhizophila]QTK30728.1 hypothetical protein J5U48_06730 [Kocuria rhizophila]